MKQEAAKFIYIDETMTIAWETIILAMKQVLEPLYGSQEDAIEKIRVGADRITTVLLDNTYIPVGLLIYKIHPSDEYRDFGVVNSLEVKTLFVLDPLQNSGKGFGKALVNRAKEIAIASRLSSIHLTVCNTKPEVVKFFSMHNFNRNRLWDETKAKECLLVYNSNVEQNNTNYSSALEPSNE